MQLKEQKKALQAFGKYVVQQARTILTKNKCNDKKGFTTNNTKQLYDSLSYQIDDVSVGSRLYFEMEDYGQYQDRGVSGTERKYNTPFSYKSTSKLIGLEYNTGYLGKWAAANKLQPRLKNGRYGTYKQMGFILAQSIKKKGLKPSLFFTKPFERGLKRLPEELANGLSTDFDNFLS